MAHWLAHWLAHRLGSFHTRSSSALGTENLHHPSILVRNRNYFDLYNTNLEKHMLHSYSCFRLSTPLYHCIASRMANWMAHWMAHWTDHQNTTYLRAHTNPRLKCSSYKSHRHFGLLGPVQSQQSP
jgi:hypothetical protein